MTPREKRCAEALAEALAQLAIASRLMPQNPELPHSAPGADLENMIRQLQQKADDLDQHTARCLQTRKSYTSVERCGLPRDHEGAHRALVHFGPGIEPRLGEPWGGAP